jgi:putative endonuclease
MRGGWVYIMTNWSFGTLYVGVTSDLDKRVAQHKAGTFACFTHRYRVTRLA